MKTITLNVTQADIDKARIEIKNEAMPSVACPIAQALQREFPDAAEIAVGMDSGTIDMRHSPEVYEFNLPREAKRFIRTFDHKAHVKPITFELDLVDTGVFS